MFKDAEKILKKLENPFPNRDREVEIRITDFTCKSIITSRIVRGVLTVKYIPHEHCIELVSLREYITSLRNEEIMHESLSIYILDNIVEIFKPHYVKVIVEFKSPPDMEMDLNVFDEYSSAEWRARKNNVFK